MHDHRAMLLIAVLVVLAVAPLSFGVWGWSHARGPARAPHAYHPPWHWPMSVASLLLYTLAFNITFLVQELGLVLPKAMTPGLRATLYHNNHHWEGSNPLASLWQGTGVVATLMIGLAAFVSLHRVNSAPAWWRLLLFWLAFAGVFMALPQIFLAPLLPNGDVGIAMAYLGLSTIALNTLAVLALAAMPLFALQLLQPLLSLAECQADLHDARARMRFVFLSATLPATLAIVTLLPFRMPRDWIEVAVVPAVVTVSGLGWLQSAAWRAQGLVQQSRPARWPVRGLLTAVIVLLLAFQCVLRRGITF